MKDEETGCHTFGATYWHSALTFPVWLIPCPIPKRPYGFCGHKAPSEIIFGTMKEKRLDATTLGPHTDTVHCFCLALIPYPIPNEPCGFCGRKAPSEIVFGTMKEEETGCHTFGATYWHSALTVPLWHIPCPIPNGLYGFCGRKAPSEVIFGTMKEEDWMPHLWGHILTVCSLFMSE